MDIKEELTARLLVSNYTPKAIKEILKCYTKWFKMSRAVKCPCGTRINKRNLCYYINEYNEKVPICRKCVRVIKEYQEGNKKWNM